MNVPLPLADAAAVLAATGDDPLTRSTLVYADRAVAGWADGPNVLWRGQRENGDPVVVGVGEVAGLLAEVAGELPDDASFSMSSPPRLPPRLRVVRQTHWELRWTRDPLPGQPHETLVEAAQNGEVAALIAVAYPDAEARPGSPDVRGWVGIRDVAAAGGSGMSGLAACAADTSGRHTGRISAVMTAPAARGRGLGAAVTAALTRRLLAEFGLVVLGVYLDNAAARRLYRRIGYGGAQVVTSGRWVAGT